MFNKVSPGKNVPDDVNVIVEIPAHSEPVKYEADKETGLMCVDRFMISGMRYPCDYGFIPGTLSEDGDPVDVLIVSPYPLIGGSLIRVRPIGLLRMVDESGKDAKILAVPIDKLTTAYQKVQNPDDLPPLLLDRIVHFFQHYKDLEENKWAKVEGWENADMAKAEILRSMERFSTESKK